VCACLCEKENRKTERRKTDGSMCVLERERERNSETERRKEREEGRVGEKIKTER